MFLVHGAWQTCSHSQLQAELDHHVRDTYNYVTVQADIVMPGRQLAVLEDAYRQVRVQ